MIRLSIKRHVTPALHTDYFQGGCRRLVGLQETHPNRHTNRQDCNNYLNPILKPSLRWDELLLPLFRCILMPNHQLPMYCGIQESASRFLPPLHQMTYHGMDCSTRERSPTEKTLIGLGSIPPNPASRPQECIDSSIDGSNLSANDGDGKDSKSDVKGGKREQKGKVERKPRMKPSTLVLPQWLSSWSPSPSPCSSSLGNVSWISCLSYQHTRLWELCRHHVLGELGRSIIHLSGVFLTASPKSMEKLGSLTMGSRRIEPSYRRLFRPSPISSTALAISVGTRAPTSLPAVPCSSPSAASTSFIPKMGVHDARDHLHNWIRNWGSGNELGRHHCRPCHPGCRPRRSSVGLRHSRHRERPAPTTPYLLRHLDGLYEHRGHHWAADWRCPDEQC